MVTPTGIAIPIYDINKQAKIVVELDMIPSEVPSTLAANLNIFCMISRSDGLGIALRFGWNEL